jgi:hypothetical protein
VVAAEENTAAKKETLMELHGCDESLVELEGIVERARGTKNVDILVCLLLLLLLLLLLCVCVCVFSELYAPSSFCRDDDENVVMRHIFICNNRVTPILSFAK